MQVALDALVSATGMLTVGQYAWSLRFHFRSARTPPGAMLISAMVVATLLFLLALQWWVEQPVTAQVLGFALQIASNALFWWAIAASRTARLRFAFDEEGPDSLVTSGPYRHLRHPFYSSYVLFWAGWSLATWSVWALVPLAGLVTLYVAAAKGEERKFAATAMAGEYLAYRRRAGLMWPKLWVGT